MKYIDQALQANERVIKSAVISKWSLFHLYFSGVVFCLTGALLPVGVFMLVYAWLKIRGTEIALTERRVIFKTGIISRDTSELRASKIESVSVKQGILGRMFGFGNVIVSGTGGNTAILRGIVDPLAFRDAVAGIAEH